MCEEHFIGMQRVSVTIDHEIHRLPHHLRHRREPREPFRRLGG